MQEEAKTETPMVDIDTSGPSAEVELKDEAQTEEPTTLWVGLGGGLSRISWDGEGPI